MGNWNISINGHGCHHNNRSDVVDADAQTKEFVKSLKAAGHQIDSATFTVGAPESMLEPKEKKE